MEGDILEPTDEAFAHRSLYREQQGLEESLAR